MYSLTPDESILYAVLFQAHLSSMSSRMVVKRSDLLSQLPILGRQEMNIFLLLNSLMDKGAISILDSDDVYETIELKLNMWSTPKNSIKTSSAEEEDEMSINDLERQNNSLNQYLQDLQNKIDDSILINKNIIEGITIKFK